ncbi:membrane-bound lytic murein transglycosylase D [Lacunisphaera limnophila]|uniref:Membrane-bound lytic murein transglycosylase D n=1 Tax=Lacunisphaera limnophila TaxID=1838286 RepID=A0A1D8AYQ4_9BACT|nr:LysM peptidoglycan-binding domain-containing protein [Lacunisphaera limnophila]AOS45994.1 membrane-bound lytic murein transglycosylase D [Lacunisphaera limnophila]
MRAFSLRCGALLAFLAVSASAQMDARAELAALRQDVMLLTQRVGELTMTVEQLNRENEALQDKANRSYATVDQLNKAVADMNRTLQAELGDQKREVLAQVAGQLEKLGRQTNAALEAVAKNQAARPVVQTTFSDNFPKEGINYTVQAGDTLAVIARKNNAKLSDIVNANKISDPTRIQVGQTLFIPQGK